MSQSDKSYVVYSILSELRHTQLTGRPTFVEAKEFVRAYAAARACRIIMMEDDADHDGCADAFLSCGALIVIEPEGFKL